MFLNRTFNAFLLGALAQVTSIINDARDLIS
jgi:hypothetical protein